jgi:hypothetical protein
VKSANFRVKSERGKGKRRKLKAESKSITGAAIT